MEEREGGRLVLGAVLKYIADHQVWGQVVRGDSGGGIGPGGVSAADTSLPGTLCHTSRRE